MLSFFDGVGEVLPFLFSKLTHANYASNLMIYLTLSCKFQSEIPMISVFFLLMVINKRTVVYVPDDQLGSWR